MSMEVQQYLNDTGGNFTEMAPRPPVPGEENELQSNGGISTRSSGSHKSGLSGKSHSSGKSGVSHRSDTSHSPAATPRRSNLDKTTSGSLGFEPEGSAASSPPFTENSTPPYLKWAENINYLLDDSDGVKLFKQFLDQEQCSYLLNFWFACNGLKLVEASDKDKILSLSKLIYKKYIKGDQLNLRPEIKKNIIDCLKKEQVDQKLFDEAQTEVQTMMKNDSYPLFLKSDIYLQYVQNGGESPKTSNNSSESNSARPLSGPLPTLHEGEELRPEDIKTSTRDLSLPLTSVALYNTRKNRESWSNRRPEGAFPAATSKPPNPYHISYAPVSAQDSDRQSLSSDAPTDDTMSLTDSSVDGREIPPFGSKGWKKHKALRRIADANRHTNLNQTLIPRTERAPKDRNLAEKEPEKFAAMLMERLERVKEAREKLEQVHESMRSVEADEDLEATSRVAPPSGVSMCKLPPTGLGPPVVPVVPALAGPGGVPPGGAPAGGGRGAVPLDALLTSAMVDRDGDDNAQSILEEHCSRVWDSSNGQTPSRSPGRHSPDRSFRYPHPPGPSPNVSGTSLLHQSHLSKSYSHHRRKATDKDNNITGGGVGGGAAGVGGGAAVIGGAGGGGGALGGGVAGGVPNPAFLSTQSFDSGMGTESTGVYGHEPERHKHVYHHYHHHHHHIPKDGKGVRNQSSAHPDHGGGDAQGRGGLHYPGTPAALRSHPDSGHGGVGAAAGAPGGVLYPHTAKDLRRSGVKKVSDTSSNLDSGVSVACDVIPSVPNLNDPASEKVMAWMLENDKLTTSNTQYSTDGSDKGSSQKRSSHKSSSAASQHKSSSSGSKSKQPLQYNASRSGSLDRGSAYPLTGPGASMSHSFTMGMPGVGGASLGGLGTMPGLGSVTALGNPGNLTFCSGLSLGMASGGVQPSQPISQDPSMPLLNPPNPTTQLEEAKRRLEDESNKARMLKSKSFSVASSKDRRSMPPPCQPVPPRSLPASHSRNIPSQNAPLDLSSSEDHSSYGSHKSESKKSFNKRTSSLPTTPGQQPDSTVIGYYLGNEPIPYRTQLPFRQVTLAQFKALMSKKGNYRYFFKTASDDFGPGVVHEEVTDDNAVLPLWEGKVIGKVEKIE